jgi:hypothetical protein
VQVVVRTSVEPTEVHLGVVEPFLHGDPVRSCHHVEPGQEHPGADVPERDAERLRRQPPSQVVEHGRGAVVLDAHDDRLRVVRRRVVPRVLDDARPR